MNDLENYKKEPEPQAVAIITGVFIMILPAILFFSALPYFIDWLLGINK